MAFKRASKIKKGDIVKITENKGNTYIGFVVKPSNTFKGVVLRVLEGESPRAAYYSSGIEKDARFQLIKECKDIEVLSHSNIYEASNYNSTKIKLEGRVILSKNGNNINKCYTAKDPITGQRITYCEDNTRGGWSFGENDVKLSILEAYNTMNESSNDKDVLDVLIENVVDDKTTGEVDLMDDSKVKQKYRKLYPTNPEYYESSEYVDDMLEMIDACSKRLAAYSRFPSDYSNAEYSKKVDDIKNTLYLDVFDYARKMKEKYAKRGEEFNLSVPAAINFINLRIGNKVASLNNYLKHFGISLDATISDDEGNERSLYDTIPDYEADIESNYEINDNIKRLFNKYPEGSRERRYLEWMATKARVLDFGMSPEDYGVDPNSREGGWTDEFLARYLGWKTARGNNRLTEFKNKMKNDIIKFFSLIR